MTAGQPTKYREKFTKKAIEYLEKYKELDEKVPSIEGFAEFIEVSKKTIYNWCKEKENSELIASDKFLHALERIKTKQGRILQNSGLDGTFNSTITKLMLSANHDMREKSDVTTDDKPMPAPIYGGKSTN
jgi:predicted DNA-binding protein YlxM (UPF0122 family)